MNNFSNLVAENKYFKLEMHIRVLWV